MLSFLIEFKLTIAIVRTLSFYFWIMSVLFSKVTHIDKYIAYLYMRFSNEYGKEVNLVGGERGSGWRRWMIKKKGRRTSEERETLAGNAIARGISRGSEAYEEAEKRVQERQHGSVSERGLLTVKSR